MVRGRVLRRRNHDGREVSGMSNNRVGDMAGGKCWQRQIREEVARSDKLTQWDRLTNPCVKQITTAEAKGIILKYEWLGTMGRSKYCVGLFDNG